MRHQLKISDCRRAVQVLYRIPKADILSRQRRYAISHKRQVAMLLAREVGGHELTKIARYFRRDHSTVHHGIRSVYRRAERNPALAEDVAQLRLTLAVYAAQKAVGE